MLRWLILKKLDAVEKQLGASIDYLRHIVRTSLRAFFKFAKIMPIAVYRRKLPPGPWHVAHMVAARDEDCGTCVQIAVNQAKKDGLAPQLIQAVLNCRPDDLPQDLADAYRFTEAVVQATYDEEELRERIRRRHGEEALIELALAIASSRFFPITKRALGYATSCSRVTLNV